MKKPFRLIVLISIILSFVSYNLPKTYADDELQQLRKDAEQGNVNAQARLGYMYQFGKGIPRDYKEAIKWYRKAADQGKADAQYQLGVMYHKGQGVPQNYSEAIKWYRKAADQGNADAQYTLGALYYYRKGNYSEAIKWARKAAAQGIDSAQYLLGVMYYDGKGVPQHYVRAYAWFNLAAAQGHSEADMVRDRILKSMTPRQIESGQELSIELQSNIKKKTQRSK